MHPRWRRCATRCVRRGYDRDAWVYDDAIRITEWLVVGDGRAWIDRHADGDTLEVALGTRRNLPAPRSVRREEISREKRGCPWSYRYCDSTHRPIEEGLGCRRT